MSKKTYYFDTNALWKYYQDQKGDLNVRRLVANSETQVLVSSMTTLEFIGVLMKYYRKRLVKRRDVNAIVKRLRRDADFQESSRPFRIVHVSREVFRRAHRILLEHAAEFDLQTNDAIHLALACEIQASISSPVVIVSSDNSLIKAAERSRMMSYDPGEAELFSE